MNRKLFILAPGLFVLSACANLAGDIESRVDDTQSKAEKLVKDVGRTAPGVVAKSAPLVEHEDGIWLGKNIVKVGQPTLPTVFHQPATFDRTVASLSEFAERIAIRSGIPTKVTPDALAVSSGASLSPSAKPAPSGPASWGGPSSVPPPPGVPMAAGHARAQGPIRIEYSRGTFKGLLDMAAARFGVYWKYVNGTIQFFHTESRTFQITAIPGDSTFKASVASGATSTGGTGGGNGGGGSSDSSGVSSNNSQNTAVSSNLSVYSSMEKSISSMLSAHGKVVTSPATGTITVVDTPDTLERVASFIDDENKALARQVVINVTVLAVTLNNTDQYGINWDLVYKGLRQRYGILNTLALNPVNGTNFSAGILATSTSNFAGSSLVMKALSEQGKVRRQTTASVVTLNNQPVPVQVAKQTSYLKSSQTTVTPLVGTTTTLTPGMVTSGFNMSILPHVLANGTVLLQFSTDISALRGIRTVTSNNSSIESPELDTRNFLQRIAMKSNETLIISGFEQTDDNLDNQGVGTPKNFLLGGGFKAATNKEVIVILITPTTMASS
ncbi:PilN family type IVB pilus formation outer membrane protein [Noviherbaspirillum sp.]|jgi:type IVB pilus formation R64 PilN family outer membrane protein|uniref:PilN family type IVB pilus formation outer membrane protein n=1 Tax=Noviherbaspirillum sp. TaxID=1926288 RepID=UPI0025F6C6EE|nr:PilN family type IVB pilus formation outer membrane protein [Noviherbaspirillum sp.]